MKLATGSLAVAALLMGAVSCDSAGDAAAKHAVEKAAERNGRPVQVEIDREGKSITVTLEERQESDSR